MKQSGGYNLVKTKRFWLIIIVVGLIFLGGIIGVVGYLRQIAGFEAVDTQYDTAKRLSDTITNAAGSRDGRTKALSQLAAMPHANQCDGDWWNSWQHAVVPAVRTDAQACRSKHDRMVELSSTASKLSDYLKVESDLTDLLSKLSIDNREKNWPQNALKAAQSVKASIDDIRSVEDSRAIQKQASRRTGAIITAWELLNAASVKQDKVAYLKAEAAVKQAYADLGAIADESDAALTKLINAFQRVAKDK